MGARGRLQAAHLSGPRSVPDAASSGPTLKAPGSAGGYLLPRCRSRTADEKATSPIAYWLGWENLAQSETLRTWRSSLRNLGGLTCARPRAGPAREGRSRTPSVYVGEKSDEVVVPKKRSNKGRQLPAEIVEGRASPEGNSRQAAVVRTLSRVATSIRLAAVRRRARGFTVCRLTFDPREEPGALAAHAGICAGGGEQSSSLPRPAPHSAAAIGLNSVAR